MLKMEDDGRQEGSILFKIVVLNNKELLCLHNKRRSILGKTIGYHSVRQKGGQGRGIMLQTSFVLFLGCTL